MKSVLIVTLLSFAILASALPQRSDSACPKIVNNSAHVTWYASFLDWLRPAPSIRNGK